MGVAISVACLLIQLAALAATAYLTNKTSAACDGVLDQLRRDNENFRRMIDECRRAADDSPWREREE